VSFIGTRIDVPTDHAPGQEALEDEQMALGAKMAAFLKNVVEAGCAAK
jgi:hypothetical protein